MSNFLWVEDFEKSAIVTASNLFTGIVDEKLFSDTKQELKNNFKDLGIYIELSLQDGLQFIQTNLHNVDYIILDIDLPVCTPGDEPDETILELLKEFYSASESDSESESSYKRAELKKVAGYHIYTKLIMELGFPKENILFCSDHGDQLKTILEAFKKAKIKSPKSYEKSHAFVNNWVKERHENPYSRLRRGIIEGCKYLRTLPENGFQFNKFIDDLSKQVNLDDIHNYLEVLERFLPLRVPDNATVSYKLFIRSLAHEWEAANPKSKKFAIDPMKYKDRNKHKALFAFSSTMKMSRNWLAHGKAFENLNEQDVAYLFIVNMRAMFDLGDDLVSHEKYLLKLFPNAISKRSMLQKVGHHKFDKGRGYKIPVNREIPFEENYAILLDKTGNTWQAINFNDALNNLQQSNEIEEDKTFLIKGLYQTFWFLTSVGGVCIPKKENKPISDLKNLIYEFSYYDYTKQNYIFEIARHIYIRSFLK